jgi:hypothetical protein
VSLSDAQVSRARSASEDARQRWLMEQRDAWRGAAAGPSLSHTYGNGSDDDQDENGDDDDLDPVEAARQAYIRRITTDYQRGGAYARPNPSHGYPGPSDYAEGVWSSMTRSPDTAQRRMSLSPASDAGEDAKAQAYSEYLNRIATDWMR